MTRRQRSVDQQPCQDLQPSSGSVLSLGSPARFSRFSSQVRSPDSVARFCLGSIQVLLPCSLARFCLQFLSRIFCHVLSSEVLLSLGSVSRFCLLSSVLLHLYLYQLIPILSISIPKVRAFLISIPGSKDYVA
uniref:Uncharacterized protein n=1 Tax=Myotis myotis TaxID=51298 RepID=A0A7J7Y008_MYOMY|nr:hypothetical protein mMyoMyo1_011408 [Myotis myotis]